MKALIALVSTSLALSACSSVTGPDADARAAKARANLVAASKVPALSKKLAAN